LGVIIEVRTLNESIVEDAVLLPKLLSGGFRVPAEELAEVKS
jgi:hypothetical protein